MSTNPRKTALISANDIATITDDIASNEKSLTSSSRSALSVEVQEGLQVVAKSAVVIASQHPVYLELPVVLSPLVSDWLYISARPHGRAFYREEMYLLDESSQLVYWPIRYRRDEVLGQVDANIRPTDRRAAVTPPLAWRIGFAVGWLSALSEARPDAAQAGLIVLAALVAPLLIDEVGDYYE